MFDAFHSSKKQVDSCSTKSLVTYLYLLYIPLNTQRTSTVCVPLDGMDSLKKCTGQWMMLGGNLRTNRKTQVKGVKPQASGNCKGAV